MDIHVDEILSLEEENASTRIQGKRKTINEAKGFYHEGNSAPIKKWSNQLRIPIILRGDVSIRLHLKRRRQAQKIQREGPYEGTLYQFHKI